MFKDNSNLRKGLLVGVFGIPLSELGSGANNIKDFPMVPFKDVTGNGSISNANDKHSGMGLGALTDSFWFNTKEVEKLLDQSAIRFPQIADNKGIIMSTIKKWYSGYHIGRFNGKYNPWSVCSFIESLDDQLESSENKDKRSVSAAIGPASRAYWVNTGTTDVIETQFRKHRQQAASLMRCLINEYRRTRLHIHDPDIGTGSSQESSLKLPRPDMGIISTGEYSNERMLTLCLFAGYLTHKHPDLVCIPNREVYDVWYTLFTRIVFSDSMRSSTALTRGSLLVEFWNGETAGLCRFIKDAVSNLAKHRKYKEREYANVIATALTAASCLGAFSHPNQTYSRVSDAVTTRENYTGRGYSDHVMWLYSSNNLPNQFCAVIEYKFIPDEHRDNAGHHEHLANKALDQIIEKNYTACVSGCVERIDIGIAVGNNVLCIRSKLYRYNDETCAWDQVQPSTGRAV
ncbi:hypothetical protein EV175_001094 [Coemansia sp. RSA 1933]|nr:hypothetical protein EV175_001094 [Coemansia sp. RSA 1933]